MKKYILAAAAVFVLAIGAQAQSRFGIQAGLTSSSASLKEVSTSSVSNYHAGIFYQIPLAAGFSFQPGLLYQVKGASLNTVGSVSASETFAGRKTPRWCSTRCGALLTYASRTSGRWATAPP